MKRSGPLGVCPFGGTGRDINSCGHDLVPALLRECFVADPTFVVDRDCCRLAAASQRVGERPGVYREWTVWLFFARAHNVHQRSVSIVLSNPINVRMFSDFSFRCLPC